MKTILIVLLLPISCFAGAFGKLICKECNYSGGIMRGPAMRGYFVQTFYCKKLNKFVSHIPVQKKNDSLKEKVKPEQSEAVETKLLVAKESEFHIYTNDSCPNGLIPAEYYLKNPKIPCPLCGKGSVEYENIGFID